MAIYLLQAKHKLKSKNRWITVVKGKRLTSKFNIPKQKKGWKYRLIGK